MAAFALLLLGAVVPGPGRSAVPTRPSLPNIILILTDDLDVNLHSLLYMPKLKALLSDQGTTFANHFVPVSLCCPSRATILRGQYSHNHHIYSNFPPDGGFQMFQDYNLDRATIATALAAAGYRTVLLGKYLNGYPLGEATNYVPPGWSEWYVPSDNDAYGEFNYQLNENGKLVDYGGSPGDYLTDVLAAKAAGFIRRAQTSGQPYFMYLASYAPHAPATPAPRHQDLFPDLAAPRPPSFDEGAATLRDKPAQFRGVPPLAAKDVAKIDALYRRRIQSLQAVDDLIARVMFALQGSGQLDHTYVVFTSDNGFHMGEHRFRPGKYTAYEEDVHVPLVVRGPGVPAGRVRDDLTSSVDLAPTFADLAGAALAVRPDGRSLVPLFAGAPAPADWRQAVLLEQRPFPQKSVPTTPENAGVLEPPDLGDKAGLGSFPPVTFRGVRTKTTKYVEYASGEREYYDLAADPYELHNLAKKADRAYLGKLSQVLSRLQACAGKSCRAAESTPLPVPP
ncbi:MAG: N-acetylglucosamine-6-sulfatase [Acidobacteriota bacterium]|jgi:arylsulfatase A-like enzyme|nr:N-acetylglucosamine-6-sulfatase [Acidobacteriota bacterium]